MSAGGCLPGGQNREMPVQGGACPGGCLPRGLCLYRGCLAPPFGQTDACENITLAEICLRAVINQ